MSLYLSSFWIPLLVLIPNFLYMFFPPKDSAVKPQRPKWWRIIIAFERIGQIGIFILPFFWKVGLDNSLKITSLIIMAVSITVYYYCWIRYILKDRKIIWLYEKLSFLPVPLAISPIMYYIFASIVLNSLVLGIFTIVLSIGHIPESHMTYIQNKN